MKLKSFVFSVAAMAVMSLAFAFTTPTYAQNTVNNSASVTAANQNGTTITGTQVGVSGTATDKASAPKLAQGNSDAAGVGTGSGTQGVNNSNAAAKSGISLLGNANGTNTNVTVKGSAQQGDWAGTKSTNSLDYGNSGMGTEADLSGSAKGTGPLTGTAAGTATGKSSVGLTGVGTNSVKFNGQTVGDATSATNFTGAPKPIITSKVVGVGFLNGQAVAGDTNGPTYAAGTVTGGGTFNGANPAGNSTGHMTITGQAAGAVGKNSISASAASSSTSSVK